MIPRMRSRGFSEDDIAKLTIDNPARVLCAK
jgi:predicted metal-dependent phosphotriesterase family hydrolase